MKELRKTRKKANSTVAAAIAVSIIVSGALLSHSGEATAAQNVVFDSRTVYPAGFVLTRQSPRVSFKNLNLTGGAFLNIGEVSSDTKVFFILAFALADSKEIVRFFLPVDASGATGIDLPEGVDMGNTSIEVTGVADAGKVIWVQAFTITLAPADVGDNVVKPKPVANAGEYGHVEANSTGGANITLDGTESADPLAEPLTYSWSGPFGVASGVTPSVYLPLGTSTVALTVTAGDRTSDIGIARITVSDTVPPLLSSNLRSVSGTEQSGKTVKKSFQVELGARDVADAAPTVSGDINGIGVNNGMTVELVWQSSATGTSSTTKPGGTLVIIAPSFTYRSLGRDASGNSAAVSATPNFNQ